jgi:hypothetical protein
MERFRVSFTSPPAEGDGEPECIIEARPLLERPDIEATAIVWESAIEGTPLDLMNAAEGEQSHQT